MKTVDDIVYSSSEVSGLKLTGVWIALLLLLGATWGTAYLPLGGFALPAAMAIAVAKAGLVIWYFMEMRSSPKLALLLFSVALVMAAMGAVLTLTDYLTRGMG